MAIHEQDWKDILNMFHHFKFFLNNARLRIKLVQLTLIRIFHFISSIEALLIILFTCPEMTFETATQLQTTKQTCTIYTYCVYID